MDFAEVEKFDWTRAIDWEDTRQDYGEDRFIAMAPAGKRLMVLVYTVRENNTIRVISLRKTNPRESALHEQKMGKTR